MSEEIEKLAKELCEQEGFAWERLSDDYESPLNEYRSRSHFRKLARAKLEGKTDQ